MTVGSDHPNSTGHAFCAWCGNPLIESARFCPGCGHDLAEATLVPDTPPVEWTAETPTLPAFESPGGAELGGDAVIDSVDDGYGEGYGDQAEDGAGEPTILLWATDASPKDEQAPAATTAPATSPRRSGRFTTLPRNWVMAVAAGVAVLLIASAAGVAGYRHLRDQPVRDAFATAQRTFTPITRSLADAKDVEQVSFAGQRASAAVRQLQAQEATASSVDSELARGVTPVLTAEVAAAKAAGDLSRISDSDLTAWGDAHAALVGSLRDLAAARRSLDVHDSEAAAQIPDAQPVLPNLETVVGAAVADVAESALTSLLTDLGSAKKTVDVRDVAESAAREADSTKTAEQSMARGSEEAKSLRAFGGVYTALDRLSALDGNSLKDWGTMRQTLTTALADVPSRSTVVSAGGDAVDHVNGLVAHAQTTLTNWKSSYDAAVKDKAADSAALEEYSQKMEAQMRAYSALRGDLSDWIARVENPQIVVTYDEGYSTLSQAQWDRQAVRDAMNGLDVPTEMQTAHGQLVGVVDDAISAIQAAYDGTTDANYCVTTCYYADTPGWKRFSAESSRITDAYASADDNWHAALNQARSSIDARTLPKKPEV